MPTLATINARGVKPVVEMLKKVGGWPVLDKNWKESNWSFIDTEIWMTSVLRSGLIEVHVGKDPNDPAKLTIWVSIITTLSKLYLFILHRTETIKVLHIVRL